MIDSLFHFFSSKGYSLPEEELGRLVQVVQFKEYTKKNQILLRADEVETNCYFLLQGIVRIFYFEDGREFTRNIFTDGDFFSESASFLSEKSFGFQIDTLTPVRYLSISKNNFDFIQRTSPNLQHFFVDQLQKALVFMILKNVEFQKSALARYKGLRKKKPQLFGTIPNYILASYLNLTPEAFSRAQKQYEEENLTDL